MKLTHLSLEKMAAISQTIYSDVWQFCILIKISLKIAPNGPIDNKPALV